MTIHLVETETKMRGRHTKKKALHNNNRVEDDAEGLFNDIFLNGFSRLFFRIFVAADVDTQRKFLNIH